MTDNNKITCPNCGSDNIHFEMVSNTFSKKRGKSIWWRIFYWLCFGWLIDLMIWFFAFVPRLVYKLFKPRKSDKVKTKVEKYMICNNCGYSERID